MDVHVGYALGCQKLCVGVLTEYFLLQSELIEIEHRISLNYSKIILKVVFYVLGIQTPKVDKTVYKCPPTTLSLNWHFNKLVYQINVRSFQPETEKIKVVDIYFLVSLMLSAPKYLAIASVICVNFHFKTYVIDLKLRQAVDTTLNFRQENV